MSLEDRIHNIEQCNRCSQCKFVHMPKSQEFSSICPSKYQSRFHASSAGGQVISAYGYHKNLIEASPKMIDSVFACSMCGACETMCKSHMGDNVEPFDTILEFRAQLAEDGKVPETLSNMVKHLEQEGAPHGKRDERSRWAEGLDIKDARKETVDVLLHIGSGQAYSEKQWDNLRFIVKLLKSAKVDFGIAYDSESDSGGLAYEIGYRSVADKLAQEWADLVQKSQAKTLLAISAEAYSAFKNVYPRLNKKLSSVRVLHTTEFFEELLQQGKLSLGMKNTGKVAYHDSCRLGRRSEEYIPWNGEYIRVLNTMAVTDTPRKVNYGNDGNYDAPRQLLSRVDGLDMVELERTRQYSFCCGGCTGVKETYPDMADGAAQELLREAESVGAEVLVSGSSCCQANMAAAAKRSNSSVKVAYLFDLLEASIQEDA
ncbi:(Fe-S)-binding protein [Marinomonas mediterranea]|uniref:Uncharacterized protein n=1 Tax=Marinomonas mediterranea (strain ATCC 700492 / JCM 21426 / NBRC 103028 / MMB-1) TaxID=717774 RepID=F2K4Q0_MARM1|nr:(Fe-S)-binding protein [Marinomonas mediterranea]ADZ91443.1 protein of unknown function DUF224 cysteine-rich region domain protein [Marinomonas mediterranea MMB-1]WCN09410.1 (Fe-S)-binding protein [Marinomonas mediterranea]WCN17552.1 (Fe-S)-binding protein [Marinomonas mediterranea MMB-1]